MFQTHKIQEMTATAAICWEEKQATREDKQMREEDGTGRGGFVVNNRGGGGGGARLISGL